MAYYRATIARDGDNVQLIVHWDDNDPNRFITAPRTLSGTITEDELAHELGRDGYRVVSTESDNVGRGWAIVTRANTDHRFYDPISGGWYTFLTENQKAEIREMYPDAQLGTR